MSRCPSELDSPPLARVLSCKIGPANSKIQRNFEWAQTTNAGQCNLHHCLLLEKRLLCSSCPDEHSVLRPGRTRLADLRPANPKFQLSHTTWPIGHTRSGASSHHENKTPAATKPIPRLSKMTQRNFRVSKTCYSLLSTLCRLDTSVNQHNVMERTGVHAFRSFY
ncbi:hypothetical protein K474DRAFT_743122 [Panus rudis PR-1116 ss-1]|nr:hypothetical protein K474DRAFT_743122 [Panus rudis PR-1116 ss-1]